jgi:hypothetical protein
MNQLRSPLFIVCIALFILHQVLQKFLNVHFGLLDRYLDNLLAMPILLSLLHAERVWLFKKGQKYKLSQLEIIMATIYVVLISEILFPAISNKFTSDWADVIFYFAGSFLYYIIHSARR